MPEGAQKLDERVSAPSTLTMPTHPDVALWRPAGTDDIDRIWTLSRAIDAAEHPNHLTTREGLSTLFSRPYFEPAHDSLLGFNADGRLVCSGLVVLPPGQRTLVRSLIVGGVHPDKRGNGIGLSLLTWQVGRAKQQLAGSDKDLPGWIVAYADERAPLKRQLLTRFGFTLRRQFVSLERRLNEAISDVEPIGDVRILPYSAEFSAGAHRARDKSFRDHWGSQPFSDEAWAAFIGSAFFRPDLSFVAALPQPSGYTVIGFLLGSVNEDDWAHQGFRGTHVDMLGVLPDWRGARVASSLLRAHLHVAREQGFERVTLDVDSDSTTGALGLYLRWGFAPVHRKFAYTLEY